MSHKDQFTPWANGYCVVFAYGYVPSKASFLLHEERLATITANYAIRKMMGKV